MLQFPKAFKRRSHPLLQNAYTLYRELKLFGDASHGKTFSPKTHEREGTKLNHAHPRPNLSSLT